MLHFNIDSNRYLHPAHNSSTWGETFTERVQGHNAQKHKQQITEHVMAALQTNLKQHLSYMLALATINIHACFYDTYENVLKSSIKTTT
jgi:hypothetical protein